MEQATSPSKGKVRHHCTGGRNQRADADTCKCFLVIYLFALFGCVCAANSRVWVGSVLRMHNRQNSSVFRKWPEYNTSVSKISNVAVAACGG